MATTKVKAECINCTNHDASTGFNNAPEVCWDCTRTPSLIYFEPKVSVTEETTGDKPLDLQVGGDHYKSFKIQPIEFIYANDIPYTEGNVIKYVCRWKAKNGIKDLEKAKHYIEMLIQMEQVSHV
jgi:hypothetical protein